jgi:hypothetical protein
MGGAHGVLKMPAALRGTFGNLMEKLEQASILKAKWSAEPVEEAVGPRMGARTQIWERTVPKEGEGIPTEAGTQKNYNKQLPFDAGADGSMQPSPIETPGVAEAPSAEQGIAPSDGAAAEPEIIPAPKAGTPASVAQGLDELSQEVPGGTPSSLTGTPTILQPGSVEAAETAARLSDPAAEPIRPNRVAPKLEPVPEVEPLAMRRARLKAEALAAKAEELKKLKPDDVDWGIDWSDSNYNAEEKAAVVRKWIKEGAAEAHPDAVEHWDIIQRLENEAKALRTEHDLSLKKGGPGVANIDALEQAKWAEKKLWKEELAKIFPSKIDAGTGEYVPGFEDLNREYARAVNPEGAKADLKRPPYINRATKPSPELIKAQEAAQKAEENLKLLSDHRADTAARNAVIERNRLAQADADAANKLADQEAKIANNMKKVLEAARKKAADAAAKAQNAAAKKAAADQLKADNKAAKDAAAAARKKAAEEAAAAKAEARAKAAAERKASDAAAAKEHDAATAEAKQARETAKRVEAQRKVTESEAKKAAIPKAGKTVKGSKTEQFTVDENTAEGLRRDTVTRKDNGTYIHEKHRITFKPPKIKPKMKFEGYEPIFKGSTVTNTALGGALTGTSHVTTPIAGLMTAANFGAWAAGYHASIGAASDAVLGGLAAPSIRIGGRVARERMKAKDVPKSYDLKHYDAAVKTAGYAVTNPEAIQQYLQRKYPHAMAEHPELAAGVATTIHKQFAALNEKAPKKPFDPTLQEANFKPPRAQQVKFMRMWDALANPQKALEMGDPDAIQVIRDTMPNWYAHASDHVVRQIQHSKRPLHSRTARQTTGFLNQTVRPQDDAAALKRLQQTAGPEPMQQKQGGGIGSGSPSSKITNQAVQREMPDAQAHLLGG